VIGRGSDSRWYMRTVGLLLASGGVAASRLAVRGYGETDPVADNATPEGRQANRRVRLEIRPNEKLRSQQDQ